MLADLLLNFSDEISWLNVFRYLTFRGVLAVLTSLSIGVVAFLIVIPKLRAMSIGEVVREDDVPLHTSKGGTPTMGGVVILSAVAFSTLLWVDLHNRFVWFALLSCIAYGLIGFIDDWRKLRQQRSGAGLSVRSKLLLQSLVAAVIAIILYVTADSAAQTTLLVPVFKDTLIQLGIWFVPFTMLVLVGTSNAVNLTDGLDGLAIMPIVLVAGGLGIFSYATGHAVFADYLAIPFVEGAGELVIFCASLVGAGLAFLVYNCYPAQIFMGDTGSMGLGAAVAIVAVLIRQELVLFIMGGLFVIEAISVISQVASFKLLGRRVWLMSPLHHHFEQKGWPEPRITVRFWVFSLVMVLAGLATLKVR